VLPKGKSGLLDAMGGVKPSFTIVRTQIRFLSLAGPDEITRPFSKDLYFASAIELSSVRAAKVGVRHHASTSMHHGKFRTISQLSNFGCFCRGDLSLLHRIAMSISARIHHDGPSPFLSTPVYSPVTPIFR